MALSSTERNRLHRARIGPEGRAKARARQVKRAVLRRVELIKRIAPDGRCAGCGNQFAHAALEVDHANGRHWISNRMGVRSRVVRYEREHAAGVELRAVCRSCNAAQGGMRYPGVDRMANT